MPPEFDRTVWSDERLTDFAEGLAGVPQALAVLTNTVENQGHMIARLELKIDRMEAKADEDARQRRKEFWTFLTAVVVAIIGAAGAVGAGLV